MSYRPQMLASAVREAIAPALRDCPRECGIVSITRVEVSADLSYATVYLSALEAPDKAVTYLEGQKKMLNTALAHLAARSIPQLRFRVDQDLIQGSRIEQLLEKASKERPDDSSDRPQQ